MDIPQLLLLCLLTPLVAATVSALFLRRLGWAAGLVSLAAAGILAAAGLMAIFALPESGEAVSVHLPWFALGDMRVDMGFLFDPLAATMLLVVGVVGFCIHLFSLGYMASDGSKGRYFAGLSIFMFSMLGIVLADNLFMVFIFWELVGFSSYLLIGHYMTEKFAADAARKAFIVNRVGDFGFLLGILWTYWSFGTVNLVELQEIVLGGTGGPLAVPLGLGLLLFCGVLGKSAQMPLHVWLPDAMAGPTPVSALIHAATMVAAGVYFLCRTFFLYSPEALEVIAWIGVATALYAALCAFGQNDIKKILAFSTLSQLGYMVAAFGLGGSLVAEGHEVAHVLIPAGAAAAMFHLTTHAFFKALLFLGSGSIIHACHHEQDIFQYGGLARKMPVTFLTFTLGTLALAGLPFLAGFFSKDAILVVAKANPAAYWVLTATAFLTAFYMFRLWWITFFGQPRSEHASHARENGPVMLLPLIALAVGAVAAGYLGAYPPAVAQFLHFAPHPEGEAHTAFLIKGFLFALGGLVVALLVYGPKIPKDTLERTVPGLFAFLRERMYFDQIYNFYVQQVQQRVADLFAFLDQVLISGLLVRGTAGLVGAVGLMGRYLHVGSIHGYVYWFFLGLILFWGLVFGLNG